MIRVLLGFIMGICLSAYAETLSTSVNGVTPTCGGDLSGTYPSCAVTKINGATPALVATSGSASDLSAGTVAAARMPALSGDCSSSVGAVTTTCTKTNGVAFGTAATANTGTSGANIPLLNGQNTWGSAQILPKATVGTLPTCNAGLEGAHYGVTDALTPVALASVTGGGAVHLNVYCNGSIWIVG